MNRTTIDFGIDLGTTNSAVAVLNGVSTEIIKNNRDADITPSAISFDKRGQLYVGERALNPELLGKKDAFREFKRMMGKNHVYNFKSSGLKKTPEDLSAEVLKSLRGDVEQKTGELIESAVITVPAVFELAQCDATRRAAKLAGFKECPLLQEPVAAALAHGFQADEQRAYWLIYDFGGGTFDAAVIKAEEGTIHVVNHGGNNFLGGSDIDWAIVEQLLIPRLIEEHDFEDFTRGNEKWNLAFAKLKRAAEMAKIELSRGERTILETVSLVDSGGDVVEFDCELTQREVTRVAEPIIIKSVEICKKVLEEKKLAADAVEKVILVGGPTLAPYFREIVGSRLGIKLDHTVDPLTVVARGSAIFAGTQKLNAKAINAPALGEFNIDLKYKPVGSDETPDVGGRIQSASVCDFSGFTIEFVNEQTQWRSGKIPVRADGIFTTNLFAERGDRNIFSINLLDPQGRKQKVSPNSLSYTIGAVVEEQPLINSMGIALANNYYDRLFEKGRGLPLKATRDYRTVRLLRQGESGDILRCPVVEGENEKADRNVLVGHLDIVGKQIRRELPAGSEVEVTLEIDESRGIKIKAYVPLLDEDFETKIEYENRTPNPKTLAEEYSVEITRFNDVKQKAGAANGETAEAAIKDIDNSQLKRDVERELAAAKGGDPAAAAKCERLLQDLKIKLDAAADMLEWPALVHQARTLMKDLRELVGNYGSGQQKDKAEELAEETEEIIRVKQAERVRKKIDQMDRLYVEVLFAQPGFWVNQFRQMEKQVAQMTDRNKAERLFNQGRDFTTANNVDGLRNVVRQLWELLPQDARQEIERGYHSGLIRA